MKKSINQIDDDTRRELSELRHRAHAANKPSEWVDAYNEICGLIFDHDLKLNVSSSIDCPTYEDGYCDNEDCDDTFCPECEAAREEIIDSVNGSREELNRAIETYMEDYAPSGEARLKWAEKV